VKVFRLDELERVPVFGTLVWLPVRKTLGVTAFGINAYTAAEPGDEVVEDHDETRLGHEEVYVVVSGHAVFTVDGYEVDAPAGTFVYLDDPVQRRRAVARAPRTTVLAVGGRPGAHEVSSWEYFFPALPHMREGDYGRARAIVEEGLRAKPGDPTLLYNLACAEALDGARDEALEHLRAAVADSLHLRERAREDDDFASIRDDPRFPT
jgi:hypothetical protein